MIKLNHVSLHIQNGEKPILSDIHYHIKPQDFIILLGSNGSGKSSLLKLLDRRYTPTSGTIDIHNKLVTHYSHSALRKKIITLTQNYNEAVFNSLTVFENYLLIKKSHATRKEKNFFENYIYAFNPNLSTKRDQLVEKLSGGEKQALALGLLMLYPPEILLLDEHTSALDPKTGDQLMKLTSQLIKAHKITCILATHDLDIALNYGNRILALRHSKIHQEINELEKIKLSRQALLETCY